MIDALLDAPGEAIRQYGAMPMAVATAGFFFGGFVKGTIGFALPTIAVAVGATVLPPEVAVAYLAVPSVVMNVWQGAREGLSEAWEAFLQFRVLIGVMLVTLFAATQLLPHLDTRGFSIIMGVGLSVFSVAQLLGWRPTSPPRPAADVVAGVLAGFFGGISGAWGVPVLMLLLSLEIPKKRFIRTCAVTFLLGSVPFIAGHVATGVLNAQTAAISVLMLVPVAIGMRIGQQVQDRLDGERLRTMILTVLVLAGANFLRQAFFAG